VESTGLSLFNAKAQENHSGTLRLGDFAPLR
jgi:hypothetical protein